MVSIGSPTWVFKEPILGPIKFKTADICHLENRPIATCQRKIIRFWWNLVRNSTWNSMTVTWPNMKIFKILDSGRPPYSKSFFGHISAADCPISVKCCVNSFSQNFGNGTDTGILQNVFFCFPDAVWASTSAGSSHCLWYTCLTYHASDLEQSFSSVTTPTLFY